MAPPSTVDDQDTVLLDQRVEHDARRDLAGERGDRFRRGLAPGAGDVVGAGVTSGRSVRHGDSGSSRLPLASMKSSGERSTSDIETWASFWAHFTTSAWSGVSREDHELLAFR